MRHLSVLLMAWAARAEHVQLTENNAVAHSWQHHADAIAQACIPLAAEATRQDGNVQQPQVSPTPDCGHAHRSRANFKHGFTFASNSPGQGSGCYEAALITCSIPSIWPLERTIFLGCSCCDADFHSESRHVERLLGEHSFQMVSFKQTFARSMYFGRRTMPHNPSMYKQGWRPTFKIFPGHSGV